MSHNRQNILIEKINIPTIYQYLHPRGDMQSP